MPDVHALIATDGIERRRETNDRQREPVLLRGLLFTPDGERLVPSYTVKKGKTYRYYTPIKHRRFGAWASSHGPLPAAPPSKTWSRGRSWRRYQHRTSCSRCGIGFGQPAQTCRNLKSCFRCEIWRACGTSCSPLNSVDWRSC
jgi:hypothetical protein